MLGLLTAIREYDPDRAASFSTYAVFCIRRRLLSAIKTAARKKHMPLNSAISFEAPLLDETETVILIAPRLRRIPARKKF